MNTKYPNHNPLKEALWGLILGIILMIIGFSVAHFVFGMEFFPN
ncbi:hypothetical protein ACE1TI_18020 [Alteribacillus sp. JSM 102045]